MKKSIILILCFFGSFFLVFSQDKKTEDWNIAQPTQKIVQSSYSKIIVQDLRLDKKDMGFVQKGAFNRYALIAPKISLEDQIKNIFVNWVVPKEDSDKELVVQIRDIYFSELTSSMSETGRFVFRATIFSGAKDQYQLLQKVDKKYENSSLDVTLELENEAGNLVLNTIQSALEQTQPLEDYLYTFNDLSKYDSIAKTRIPLYTLTNYNDGIYKDYPSFAQQIPTNQITEVKEKDTSLKIFYLNEEKKKRNARNYFAAVYQGKLYLNNGFNFVHLVKKGEDFYFYGYVPKKVSAGKQLGIGVATGVATALLTGGIGIAFFPTTENVLYEFRMDFMNGSFKPISEVSQEK